MLSQQPAIDYVSGTECDATHDRMTISHHVDVSNNYCAATTDQDEEIRVSAGTERDTSSLAAAVDCEIVTRGLPDEVDHIRVRQAFVDDEDDQTADQQQHGSPRHLEETNNDFERPRNNEHCKHVIVTDIDGNTSQTDHETSLSNNTVTPEQCEVADEWMEYLDSTNNDGDEHMIREPHEYESLKNDFAGERNDDNMIEESQERVSLMSDVDGEQSDDDNMIEESQERVSLMSDVDGERIDDDNMIEESQERVSLMSDVDGEQSDDDNMIEESQERVSLMSDFDGERSDDDSNMMEEFEEYMSLTSAFTEGRNDTEQHDSESGVASGATDVQVLVSTRAVAQISSGVEVDYVDQEQLPVMPPSLDSRVGSSSTQEEMDFH